MTQSEIQISFDGLDALEASQAAGSLMSFLGGACPQVGVRPLRTNPDAQDMGSTLVLLFGTPALVALAQGIKAWLEQRDKGELTIKTQDGEIVAKGLSSHATREALLSAIEASGAGGTKTSP